jgi:hypothetical protein
MKLNFNKSTVFANGWRCGALLFASMCLVWLTFSSSSAQLKTPKHVTSLQLGRAAEGARVTIVADSALNDYEAFRRGERFYVKIPQAEFAFSQPRFNGDGFEDVQVQKVGDSVVVSFKLQPGASAHVEEHSNRLEVIFTALRTAQRGNMANIAGNRTTAAGVNRSSANQSNPNRQIDVAGPAPSDEPRVSRQRFANRRGNEVDETGYQPEEAIRAASKQRKTKVENSVPVASATPVSVASPAIASNYPASSHYTPPTATSTPTSATASKPGFSGNSPNRNKVGDWFSVNWKASLLGALILAALLGLLAPFLYRRRTAKDVASRVKHPLTQPKFDRKVELDELTDPRPEPMPVSSSPVAKAPLESDWSRVKSQPAFAPATEVPARRAPVRSRPSISSAVVADSESVREEREVFEL